MSQLRGLTWSLSLLGLLAPLAAATAAEPAPPREQTNARLEFPAMLFLERMNHLLVPGAQEKLDLKADQLDRLAKLQYEFRAHRRDLLLKLADNLGKCREKDANGEDHLDALQAALTVFTGLVRMRGVRDQFEAQARDLLTPEQKKQYAHLENEWLRRLSERRALRAGDREFRVFASPCQEQMKLTAEQRQQLGQLRRDVDSKLKTILTNEQYQQLHQRDRGFQPIRREEDKSNIQPADQEPERDESDDDPSK